MTIMVCSAVACVISQQAEGIGAVPVVPKMATLHIFLFIPA